MKAVFGKPETICFAKVYKSDADAKAIERKHILVRNKLATAEPKEKKEEKKVEKKEEPKKEEPKQEKEEEKKEEKEEKKETKEEKESEKSE
jgi:ribosomal protein S24E